MRRRGQRSGALKTLETLGPRHGYGIARRIEQISDALLTLNEGTLYASLMRRQRDGWTSATRGASENNRKAKFYAITRSGRRQLAREAESWERMAGVIARDEMLQMNTSTGSSRSHGIWRGGARSAAASPSSAWSTPRSCIRGPSTARNSRARARRLFSLVRHVIVIQPWPRYDRSTMNAEVLVISGSMGCGKTTVLGEASDILAVAGISHASIDLDAIATALLPEAVGRDVASRNLASIYRNVRTAGVARVLVAQAVESRRELDRLREAMPDARMLVCRLTAALATMQARLRTREPGMLQDRFLARAASLERMLDEALVEDFTIVNDRRSVTDVAREMLERARWIPTASR